MYVHHYNYIVGIRASGERRRGELASARERGEVRGELYRSAKLRTKEIEESAGAREIYMYA